MRDRYDDDYEDDDHTSSHRSSWSDAPSSHGSRENFGKTSSFSTMLSDDGKFFGINLSPELNKELHRLYPIALPIITEKVEAFAEKAAGTKYAKLTSAVGWVTALSEQTYKVGENLWSSAKAANDLRVAVQPLQKMHQLGVLGALSGSNEVIANARGKISGIFWQRMLDTVVSTIGAAPAIHAKINRKTAVDHEKALQKKYEAAKGNPEEIKKLEEARLTGTVTEHGTDGITERERRAARTSVIDDHEAEYIAKHKAFEKKRLPEVQKEIGAELEKLTAKEGYDSQLSILRQKGLDVSELQNHIKAVRRYDSDELLRKYRKYVPKGKTDPDPEAVIGELITEFKKDTTFRLKYHAEKITKAEFVKSNGAWDKGWYPEEESRDYYNRGERESRPTLKGDIEERYRKVDEERRALENEKLASGKKNGSHGSGKKEDMHNLVNAFWGVGASVVREIAGKAFSGIANEHYAKPIALDRILHLRRSMEAPKDNTDWTPPDEVPPIPREDGRRGGDKERSMSYVQYVHEIFQQHQKDSKRVEIGERFFQHFEKSRWKDDAIQNMSDDELTPYEYALKIIAKRVQDGRMDAIALVELVGNPGGNKIVQNDARSFGPQGSGKDDASAKKAILRLIDEKTATMHTSQEKTEEQVNDKLANFVFSVEDMKKSLESDTLDKSQRAFIFTLFSDVVGSDEKLCQKLGIKTERCQELRKETKEIFDNTLDSVVATLAEMIDTDPQALEKALKITDKEKDLIHSLAEQQHDEGKHVADLTKNGREEIEGLKTLAANASMLLGKTPMKSEEGAAPVSFWQRVKHKMEELKNAKAAAPKPEKPAGRPPRHDDEDDFKPSRKSHSREHGFEDDMDADEHSFSHREKLDKHRPERHHDKGEHGRKWAADRHDGGDFGGRIRRDKMKEESIIRGGLT